MLRQNPTALLASAPVADAVTDGVLSTPVTIGGGQSMSATLPEGVKLEEGATEVTLNVIGTSRSSDIDMDFGQLSRSLDVHIDGVAGDNDVPMTIHLGAILPVGYNTENIALYHVENGEAIKMELVEEFAAHNQFMYIAETGEIVIYIASFSEITAVFAANNNWNGEIDVSWFTPNAGTYEISDAADLAGLSAIVGGMSVGKDADGNLIYAYSYEADGETYHNYSFNGETIYLTNDIIIGDTNSENGIVFYPIGYYNSEGTYSKDPNATTGISSGFNKFEGTFDGQGYTISDWYQNTWEMKGDHNWYDAKLQYYRDGMGLFGKVYKGTVKNLVVKNFSSDGEITTTGVIAAYADGATFENIQIYNCNPRVYNIGNGGIVGVVGWYAKEAGLQTTFKSITVDNSNKISALWGSYDVSCGGIVGQYYDFSGQTSVGKPENGGIYMEDCISAAVIDAYNDVCGNYQYYQYRYAGMLVGTLGSATAPASDHVEFKNVKVYIGNWANYYYCEFEKNSSASYTEDFQFSRVDESEINFNPETNLPDFSHSPCRHVHTEKEDKMGLYLPFGQLYTGYGWGSSPVFSHDGVEVINYFYKVTYMDAEGSQVLHIDYVTEGDRNDRLWASAYTAKTECITNKDGKIFKGWVNANSVITDSIAAGNRKDVVLYESWDNPYIIRFVDRNGNVIYSEAFTDDHKTLSYVPAVPEVEGYYGIWEPYESKLINVTSDVTIHPIYTIEQIETGDIIAPGSMTAAELFAKLSKGDNLVMSEDLEDDGQSLKGGKNDLCIINGTTSRLNLNNSKLTCNFQHNANKEWTIFNITGSSAELTIAGGVNGEGTLHLNLNNMNDNAMACVFNVESGGTLVLEAGVTIEINYPPQYENKVTAIRINGAELNAENYPGFYVEKDAENGIIRIIVGVTTTIKG